MEMLFALGANLFDTSDTKSHKLSQNLDSQKMTPYAK